jgi:hypothetical protein
LSGDLLACSDTFRLPCEPGRPTPSSSMSNVSLMSFQASTQPPQGSIVSLTSPRSTLAVSKGTCVSPLTPLSTATTAGQSSSPLTDSMLCESPTEMEGMGGFNGGTAPWTELKSSSWSSAPTFLSQDSAFLSPALQFSELEGSMPESPELRFQKASHTTQSDHYSPTVLPPSLHLEHPKTCLQPAADADSEHAHASGRKSSLLEELEKSLAAELNNVRHHLGVGPLMNYLREKHVREILLIGIDELERQLAGWSGDATDKLCFAYLARAMAGEFESDLPAHFCGQLDIDMERFVWSGGEGSLTSRFDTASRYFLDGKSCSQSLINQNKQLTPILIGLQVHLHADLEHRCGRLCNCDTSSRVTADSLAGLSASFPEVSFQSIDTILQNGINSTTRDVELELISLPRLDSLVCYTTAHHLQRLDGVQADTWVQSPLEPDAFFHQYLPAVHNICDQFYCNCHDRSAYHRWAVGFMRQYYGQTSLRQPVATESRQNSWNSSTSTALDWAEPHVRSDAASKQATPVPASKAVSSQQARRPHRSASRRRSRPIRRETKKEVCPHCPYAAAGADRLKLLRRHIKTHEGTEELFECGFPSTDGSVCSKRYNRSDNLRSHQRRERHGNGGRERRLLRKRLPGGARFRPVID